VGHTVFRWNPQAQSSRPRSNKPQPLTDPGREPLDSSGSCYSNRRPQTQQLPVREQFRLPFRNSTQPVMRTAWPSPQLLVFPGSPFHQLPVQVVKGWIQRRFVEMPKVIDPATKLGTEYARQIFDRFIASILQVPATDFCPDGFCR